MVKCQDFSVFMDNTQLFNLFEFGFASVQNGDNDNSYCMANSYITMRIKTEKNTKSFFVFMQCIFYVFIFYYRFSNLSRNLYSREIISVCVVL